MPGRWQNWIQATRANSKTSTAEWCNYLTYFHNLLKVICLGNTKLEREQNRRNKGIKCIPGKEFSPLPLCFAAEILNSASQGHRLTSEEIVDWTEFIDAVASETEDIKDQLIFADFAGYKTKNCGIRGKPFSRKSVD